VKLATLKDRSRDGRLLVVSRDLKRAALAERIVPNMQLALEHWNRIEPELQALYASLNDGTAAESFAFEPEKTTAPLPRAYQFVDASAFLNHGALLDRAYNVEVKKLPGVPVMVQRQGDDFLGACDDYPITDIADNADFEGEVAVILDETPFGVVAAEAEKHVKLVMLLNDFSMRAHLRRELMMGFGFFHAKPTSVFGPVAVTPDELGEGWNDGRVQLDLCIERNGEWFGNPNGREMDYSFGELIAHLAYNRNLRAGTILGSGTFSNKTYASVGSACIAERRAIEMINDGQPKTDFLGIGERVRMEMKDVTGQSVFGAIDHRIVAARK
jgi:fumarylacetoacetate (FAA) hydrolase